MKNTNTKYKFFSAVLVLLILTNLNFVYSTTYEANDLENNLIEVSVLCESFSFSNPLNYTWGDYIYIDFQETDYFLREVGEPMLPVFKKVYTFPLGTKINNVNCTPANICNESLLDTIKPGSNIWHIPSINGTVFANNSRYEIIIENESVYSSSDLYPSSWYDYTIKCGLEENENVVFLILDIFPARYSPQENIIYYPENVDIEITYQEPTVQTSNSESYDMVIIAPTKFIQSLQPFVMHKNSVGISTKIKTTEEIFDEYSGRDPPEQIKYFIKDAKELWNVDYVLLVGGLKSFIYADDLEHPQFGSKDWYIPIRYTNLEEGCIKYGCISDLYYSDLYKYNSSSGYAFDDWDSNGNYVFAEGNYTKVEEVDLCPDVHLGRLPCRNIKEVKIVVNKIINYESNNHADDPWFRRMISISGNGGTITGGKPPLEVYCEKAIEYMGESVDPVKIYSSNIDTGGPVPIAKDILREMSKGAGFVHFMGHGTSFSWDVLWPDCGYSMKNMTGGIGINSLWRLNNRDKLPIAVVSGCSTSLFNVTLIKSLFSSRFGREDIYLTLGVPVPECLCWRLMVKKNGGAIATIGCTATERMDLDFVYMPRGFSFNAELDYDFFYQIGINNVKIFGEAYSGAITKSIKENPMRSYEMHCVMQWQCFADPSLKIGGYGTAD